jgi:excisionase family DNA binding protein
MPEEQQEKSSDQSEVGYQPGLDELIPLSEAAEQTGISASHLRLLIRRNEIWGRKLGRNWVTTKKAVDEYLAHEHKPGPKPKTGPATK